MTVRRRSHFAQDVAGARQTAESGTSRMVSTRLGEFTSLYGVNSSNLDRGARVAGYGSGGARVVTHRPYLMLVFPY